MKEVPYTWLSGPGLEHGDREILKGWETDWLASLLRHGYWEYNHNKTSILYANESLKPVELGACHFYLTTVAEHGKDLDLSKIFFLPRSHGGLILPDQMMQTLLEVCSLTWGRVARINPKDVSCHNFEYQIDDTDTYCLLDHVNEFVDDYLFEENEYYDGIHDYNTQLMPEICRFSPSINTLPKLQVLSPGRLFSNEGVIRKYWEGDQIIIEFPQDVFIHAINDHVNLDPKVLRMKHKKNVRLPLWDRIDFDPQCLEFNPIFELDGILIPREAKHLFELKDDIHDLVRPYDVVLRF